MSRPSTRRKFLAAVGAAGTFSIAGCSTVLPVGSDDSEPANPTMSTGSPSSGRGTGTSTDAGTGDSSSGPVSRGELIEDFEGDIGSRWQVSTGKYTVDKKNPYQKSQSLVLQGQNNGTKKKKNGVSIYRSFYDSGGLDLRKHDLSLAVKFEQPARGRIGIEFIAPSDSSKLTSRRYLPKELNGWTRLDFGYTGQTGQPVVKAVQELRVSVTSEKEPITVAIDDLRKLPKPKKGKVMFHFDDSHSTAYTKAFPELKQRNWTGGVAVIPDSIGTEQNMTRSQMREMGRTGWDMMSHPSVGKPLPQLPPNEQERAIQQSKQALETWGFDKGARHIVAPYGRVSTKTINIIQKHHQAHYMFGGSPSNAMHPSNMYGISRVFGTSPDDVRTLVDLADQFNQMVVISYHDIGTNSDTSVSMNDFRAVLNHIEQKNVDIVSPSQFLDSIQQ